MSEADKLFINELGYIMCVNEESIGYKTKNSLILFLLNKKGVSIHLDATEYPAMSMQELKAINEKCKELKWIE